jgi:pyrroloquinoline-quinone synthase
MENSSQKFTSVELTGSLALLHSGTEDEFVQALLGEVLSHPAVNHEYLQRMSEGSLPNMDDAIRDYAHQYSFYSEKFTDYLAAVIANMPHKEDQDILLENLEEEQGDPTSDKLEERPHVEIYRDFKKRVGVDAAYEIANPASQTVLVWRELFLQKCGTKINGVGIGAIGMATEFIVPHIYPYIISAIDNHSSFDSDVSLFFKLHVECDDEHGEAVVNLCKKEAKDVRSREAIRFSVMSSLNLRKAFWDIQLARAVREA